MAARKKRVPFCVIEVPDMRTAAVICAQLHPSASEILGTEDVRSIMYDGICGGRVGYRAIAEKVESKIEKIWQKLHGELDLAGAMPGGEDPPWLKNVPPENLNGYKVGYHGKEGVSVGCVDASLVQLELMVKACKKGEQNA